MSIVKSVETLSCDAGWRNYHFCRIETVDGIVGWSEFDEGFGSPGVGHVIDKLGRHLVGMSVLDHEAFYQHAYSVTRPAAGGIAAQGIGALENALLDAKGKALGVPCYQLLGGAIRTEIPVYWSHFCTWRINHPQVYGNPIRSLDDFRAIGEEARAAGFKAVKTNVFDLFGGTRPPKTWSPGFCNPFKPELNVTPRQIADMRSYLGAIREGLGPDVEILLDLNFNFRTEALVRILQGLADIPLFWVEIDSYNPEAVAYIRSRSPHPISSCETLIGIRGFQPYFNANAVDVAIVDTVWNGAWQSMKIANAAEAHEVNVAPHNFYGHLCTMMSAHFAAAVPNLRILELDYDRVPWDGDLFTHVPEIREGCLTVSDRPGWGTDPIEEAIRAHPPRVLDRVAP